MDAKGEVLCLEQQRAKRGQRFPARHPRVDASARSTVIVELGQRVPRVDLAGMQVEGHEEVVLNEGPVRTSTTAGALLGRGVAPAERLL